MNRKARQRTQALSKLLRYILGTAPDEFGLVLDEEGWIDLKRLVQALAEEEDWKGTSVNQIRDLGWALEESPFEIEEKRIRLKTPAGVAPCLLKREAAAPPDTLYLGCRKKPYPAYREKGVRPQPGGELILSRTKEMALRLGRRREKEPILVEIDTRVALSGGSRFQAYGKNLFVSDRLAPESISGPPVKKIMTPAPKKKARAPQTPFSTVRPPHPKTFHSKPWDPEAAQTSDQTGRTEKEKAKNRRKKKIGWKDEVRKKKRKTNREQDW